LGPHLLLPHLGLEGALRYLSLSAHVEDELCARSRAPGDLALAPKLHEELLTQLMEAHQVHPTAPLLVESEVRPELRRLVALELPNLAVVAWDEIPGNTPIIQEQEVSA
jgi:flagellar biosynthesis component FlhA